MTPTPLLNVPPPGWFPDPDPAAAARRAAAYKAARWAVDALAAEADADPAVAAGRARLDRLTAALADARGQHRQAGEDADRHATAVREALSAGQDPTAAESDRDRSAARQATYAVRIGELAELAAAAEREVAAAREAAVRRLAGERHPDARAASEVADGELAALKARHAEEQAAAEVKVADASALARELGELAWPADGYARDWSGKPTAAAAPVAADDDDDDPDGPLDLSGHES